MLLALLKPTLYTVLSVDMEIAIGFVTSIATIIASVASLGYWLGKKFQQIDDRFNLVEHRFKSIDDRFKSIEERFNVVDGRFKLIEERFKSVDDKFKSIEDKIDELRRYVDSRFNRFAQSLQMFHEFFIEYLSSEGIIPQRSKALLITEARNILKLSMTNPLTKEEWEKLKKYLEKEVEEFTLEEAYDFLEIARKAAWEYGDRPEAWKLHLYAAAVVGWTIRRLYGEEKDKEKKSGEPRENK